MERLHILLELSKYPKTKTHPTKFLEEFHTIKNKYDFSPVYTDRSQDGNKVGCVAMHRKTKLKERLPDGASLYHAELSALDLALNIITLNDH